jgi:alpha-methylacyl-CoA racemase
MPAPTPADATPPADALPPLAGLRVLEIAAIGPVPMACTLLADLGAEVWRIDRPEPSGLGLPLAPRFEVHGRSRRSLALDLKHPDGRALLLRLLEQADVLVEGLRPGAMERLGLGPDDCLARNPRLVYGRMTGWGQTGPLAATAGHDLNFIALTGVLHAVGPAGGGPLPPLNLVGDYGGGAMFLALGVLAALLERQRSGRGQVVDAAMTEGSAALAGLFHGLRAAGQWREARGTNLLDGGAPFYRCYECACGGWVALAALEARFFAVFAQRIGLPAELAAQRDDPAAWPALQAAIAGRLRSQPRAHWLALLDGSDACLSPVLTLAEAPQHPQAVARGAYVAVDGVVQPAPAPRFSRSATVPPRAAPAPGADTRRLLAEAGIDDDTVRSLSDQGVVR